MAKQRGRKILLLVVLFLFLYSGCAGSKSAQEDTEVPEVSENLPKLYYINEERTRVISKNYELKGNSADDRISECLTALEEVLWTEEEKERITDRNPICEFKRDETGVLTLRMASDYSTTQSITEVLRRAAIVKTLCQMEEVTAVEFYIGSQPLLTSAGKPVGLLTAEDFIDSTGKNTEFYQEAKISLYFANETGDALVKSTLKISYDGTLSTERLILQQLMEGPVLSEMQEVIPKGTVLNKVMIRDGICYVDFNESFLKKREDITAEVAIYSIVNSLTELSNVYKVQFLIDGTVGKSYENLDFSSPFERNLEIVEGEQ